MLVHKSVDTLDGIEKVADGCIVVERIDYVGYVLAHIYLNVPLSAVKLGTAVNQIGGKYSCKYTVGICLDRKSVV